MLDTVDIEYVGDPPILDEVTKLRIAMGELHPQAATVMRSAETLRCTAIRGINKRLVDREFFDSRLSQDYVFGPHCFVVAVAKKDVEIILRSADSHQFRRTDDPLNQIILPASNMVLVSEMEGASLKDVGL